MLKAEMSTSAFSVNRPNPTRLIYTRHMTYTRGMHSKKQIKTCFVFKTIAILKEKKQEAQLSQRDRAAGRLVMAKSGRLELGDNIYGHRSVFNQTYLARKAIEFGEERKIRAITPFKVSQGHCKLGTNRKPVCD